MEELVKEKEEAGNKSSALQQELESFKTKCEELAEFNKKQELELQFLKNSHLEESAKIQNQL